MKICIISDLHCKYQHISSTFSDTLLISNKPRIPATQHPVVSMLNAINKNSIKAEILLCLGDIGDKADEQGIASGWSFAEEIKINLGAKLLIGLPGNHDINSRNYNEKDAFSYIKNFHEKFPTEDDNLNNKFWEFGYCIVKYDKCMILMINTIHDHKDQIGAEKSSLKNSLLERIKIEFEEIKIPDFEYKICILHHHPIKHSNINNYKDSDSVENGDDLINLLNHYTFNAIVHGHKHQPRIVEYSGLPIFASGSFSCFANLTGTGFTTMFHILELFNDSKKGIIESWEYDIKNGWKKNYNANFPSKIGFGSDLNIPDTAYKINSLFQKNKKKPMFYSSIVNSIPDIEYLIPDKLIQLGIILNDKYNIKTSPEYPLQPNMIIEILN